jgi:hypothetical protein
MYTPENKCVYEMNFISRRTFKAIKLKITNIMDTKASLARGYETIEVCLVASG